MEGWGFGEGGFRVGPTLTGDNRLAILPPTHTCQAGWRRETDPLSCLPSQASTNECSGLWEAAFPPPRLCLRLSLPPQPLIIYWGCCWLRLPPLSAAVPARGSEEKALGPKMCPLCPGLPTPAGLGRQRLPAPCCAARLGLEQRALIPPVGPTSMPMRGAGGGCAAPRRAGTERRWTPGMGSRLHSQSPCDQSPTWPGEGLMTGGWGGS